MLLCELDCCKLKDGYIIAHDGCEKTMYGLDKPFNLISTYEAAQLKIYNTYTPIFYADLCKFINNNDKIHIYFVIDFKEDLNDTFINHIIMHMGEHVDKIIVQVYKKEDILMAQKYNFKCLYALWKYNSNAYNETIKQNLNYIKEQNINCIGISLSNHRTENFPEQVSSILTHGIKLYIHGENNYEKCECYLNAKLGIFSHSPQLFSRFIV